MPENLEYFENEDFKKILRQYEESVKSGEHIYMDADDLTDIADYYRSKNRLSEAEDAMSLALEYNPDAVGPMLYKARKALEANDLETAEQYADKIEPLDNIEALYLRAEILIIKKDIDGADKLLTEYLKDASEDEYNDIANEIASLYLDYSQFSMAFKWIIRSADTNSVEFKELMARTLFGLGKYAESEKIFNELIDQTPYSANYWNALAGVQYMQNDYSSALTSSEYAIAIDPEDPYALLTKANTLFAMGNYNEALKFFQKYCEKEPNDENAYLHQAVCLISQGLLKEGIELLKKAISVAPIDSEYLPDIYQEMAFTYNSLGQIDKALWSIEMTDQLDCDHTHMALTKGHILLANHKFEEAKAIFAKALKDSGNDPKMRLRIIISLHDNKFLETAYDAYKKLFTSVGENFNEGYSYLALCCKELKKYDEYLHYLKKACECNPEEAQTVLGEYFPEGMRPNDYYEYALKTS